MYTPIPRRIMILVACLAGMAWAGPAQAAPVSFTVQLSGAQQVPPVQTSATGKADLTYDPSTRVVTWTITCEGLSGTVTMAHFSRRRGQEWSRGDLAEQGGQLHLVPDHRAGHPHS